MKHFFKHDFKRIGHAAKVARYAEQIDKEEKGDPAIVLSAADLHEIWIKEAGARYQSCEPMYLEELGPSFDRDILTKLGANPGLIEEVYDILGHYLHCRPEETANLKAVYDADMIVNLEENQKESNLSPEILSAMIEKNIFTESDRQLARKILLAT